MNYFEFLKINISFLLHFVSLDNFQQMSVWLFYQTRGKPNSRKVFFWYRTLNSKSSILCCYLMPGALTTVLCKAQHWRYLNSMRIWYFVHWCTYYYVTEILVFECWLVLQHEKRLKLLLCKILTVEEESLWKKC